MARDKKCQCEAGAPAWMVTFGDLMSLLLTFFVLLLSFASMEEPKKYEATMIAIRGAFGSMGVLPQNLTTVQINPMPRPQQRPSKAQEDLARRIRRRLQIIHKEDDIKLKFDKQGGLKITLPSQILYESGKSDLKAEAYPVLDDLGQLFAELDGAFFDVRGHTDDTGIVSTTDYRDNYDLSYARADIVARYLNQAGRIPIQQFEIIACGSSQPVAPNSTEEGRQANRRVEIHVKGLIDSSRAKELKSSVRKLMDPASVVPEPGRRN